MISRNLFFFFTFFLSVAFAQTEPFDYSDFQTTNKMRFETKFVVERLGNMHYLRRGIESLDSQQFIENYLESFDRGKYHFTQPLIEGIHDRFGEASNYYIRQGNLYPAFEIFKQFHRDALARYDWIERELDKEYTFDKTESFNPDRSDEKWASSAEELDKIWRLRLKYELLNEILQETIPIGEKGNADENLTIDHENITLNSDKTSSEEDIQSQKPDFKDVIITPEVVEKAKAALRKRYDRWQKRLLEFEPVDIQEIYLTALAQTYDPHSTFWSTDSLEDFTISMQNSLVGIGALLEDVDGKCVIKKLIPGGPAKASKLLEAGDTITAVASEEGDEFVDVFDMKLRNIVKLIRGKKGSVVRLQINPAEADDPSVRKVVALERDEVKLTANLASARVFPIEEDGQPVKVGVIELPSFYGAEQGKQGGTTHDVKALISMLKEQNVDGIVLDLRFNGGGLLSEAVGVTGLFIESGPVVQIKESTGNISRQVDYNKEVAWEGPLIVLTSRHSASASEIVAGALRDYERAIIVGDSSTHGKGTVQQVIQISSGSGLLAQFRQNREQYGAAKVTIQKFFLPSGASTQNKGVPSDIVLPSVNEFLPIGESDLDNALPWDEISPSYDFSKINIAEKPGYILPSVKTSLLQKSEARAQSLPEFRYLKDTINWWKEKDEQKDISLNFDLRKEQKIHDKHIRDQLEVLKDELEKEKFTFEKVVLPSAEQQEPEEEDEDEEFTLDVPLRESLRIMNDWLHTKNEVAKL